MGNHDNDQSSGDESSHSSSSDEGSREGSPRARSRSRSGSRSSARSARSGSGSPSASPSRGRSRSRSSAGSRRKGSGSSSGGSRSRSRSKSGSRSRSGSPASRISVKAKSRSASPEGNESEKKSDRATSVEKSPKQKSRSVSPTGQPAESESPKGDKEEGEGSQSQSKVVAEATQIFADDFAMSDDDEDEEETKKSDEESKREETKSDDDDGYRIENDEEIARALREDDTEAMEVEEETLPETRIDVEIPKITTDLGKAVHFVKLPNFLSVETRPFNPDTYEDEIDDEETLDEEGRARLKLKVENTIRWRERFNEHNVFVKESNARFVRWSDGSLSLHLGGEIFNVHKQPLQGDHNHLFIRQGTGLQGQAVFRTKLTFRPHSTESFTHRKMTMSLADRSQKTTGIKVLSQVGHDPEAQRSQMIKQEEDKLRASVRRENTQRRVRERLTARGLSSNYLEPDRYENDEFSDEDNAISLSAIKNRYKKNTKMHQNIYSSDEDDDEDVRVKRSAKPKQLRDSDEESDHAAAGPSQASPKGNVSSADSD